MIAQFSTEGGIEGKNIVNTAYCDSATRPTTVTTTNPEK